MIANFVNNDTLFGRDFYHLCQV